MNQQLFAIGLFIIGFTLLFIMPASTIKSWKQLGCKPPGGDAVVFMMRFMGVLIIVFGAVILTGAIDIASLVPTGNGK